MRELLFKIFAHPELARLLVLKGSAVSYFFHQLPRFVTDLEFSLIDTSKTQYVLDEIARLGNKFGRVKASGTSKDSLTLILGYPPGLSGIKIEISIGANEKLYASELLPSYGQLVRVMAKSHLFATTLYNLQAKVTPTASDLYDVHHYFLHGWTLDENLLTSLSGIPAQAFLASLPNYLDKHFDSQTITDELNDLLSTNPEKEFIEHFLKEEIIVQIRNKIPHYDKNLIVKRLIVSCFSLAFTQSF